MEKINTAIVIFLILIGLSGAWIAPGTGFSSFYSTYKTMIELYLFIFSAYLVLKRIFFYRLKGNTEIVRLKEKSSRHNKLVVQGIVLVLFYVVYLRTHNTDWLRFDLVMIGVLLLYYIGQVLLNSNPSIYVDANAFSYDDYFIQQWKWSEMKNISLEDEKITVKGKESDFEMDLEVIDEMDYNRLSKEVDASILDGSFAEENSSTLLVDLIKSYATRNGVALKMSE